MLYGEGVVVVRVSEFSGGGSFGVRELRFDGWSALFVLPSIDASLCSFVMMNLVTSPLSRRSSAGRKSLGYKTCKDKSCFLLLSDMAFSTLFSLFPFVVVVGADELSDSALNNSVTKARDVGSGEADMASRLGYASCVYLGDGDDVCGEILMVEITLNVRVEIARRSGHGSFGDLPSHRPAFQRHLPGAHNDNKIALPTS